MSRCSEIALAAGLLAAMPAIAAEDVLEEIVVTATLKQQSLVDAPVSVTVLDERTLREAGRQHFEDVLQAVPNLHYAGGTSRPRFFQIRGIGEREEWQGAPLTVTNTSMRPRLPSVIMSPVPPSTAMWRPSAGIAARFSSAARIEIGLAL